MNILKLSELNGKINDPAFIAECEKNYSDTVKAVAQRIAHDKQNCPIILISGPSGSGKTTTAMMLEAELDAMGHETHTLSMDNYFFPLTEEEQRLAAEDKIDLESPARVDCEFLNAQLADIIACRPVELPRFNFTKNLREKSGKILTRKPGEIVVLEGIHALNPEVITVDKTVKIYVSVRTRVETACGRLIHPEYVRLLRRMHRDVTQRGRSYADTITMYPRVQRGENMYIMPYKHLADYDLDTFQTYEINAFRNADIDAMEKAGVGRQIPELIELLRAAEPMELSLVGKNALLREFIGGSEFEY